MIEYAATAPNVTFTAPGPCVQVRGSVLAVTYTVPVTAYGASALAVSYAVPASADEFATTVPADSCEIPAPVVVCATAALAATYTAPSIAIVEVVQAILRAPDSGGNRERELADSAIQIVDILVPSHQEGNVAVIQRMPQEGTHDCFAELVVPVPQVREQIEVVIQHVPVAARVRVKTPFTPHQLVDKMQRRKEVLPPSVAAARELLR